VGDGTHAILRRLAGMNAVACCKRMNLSRSQDGTITLTVVALKGDADHLAETVEGYQDGVARVTSVKADGAFTTVTVVIRSEQDSMLKIRKELVFKSIPRNMWDMYCHFMFPKAIMPTPSEPDLVIRVKQTDDWFGATGWTISSIFKELKVDLEIAAALDYHVYELRAKQGTPIISLLQSLLPVPGIVIMQYAQKFYVNIVDASSPSAPVGTSCVEVGRNTNYWEYTGIVHGLTAEPKEIEGLDQEEIDLHEFYQRDGFLDSYFSSSGEHNVQLNLIGGVYGVTKTKYTDADMSSFVEEMFHITGEHVLESQA
jgi:hypothetical protein